MKIQQQNSSNPSMKAVYFTKGQPLFNKSANYINRGKQLVKTTPNGTKYFEDVSVMLNPALKTKFENIPFIKKLAEKNEIFIQYMGEKYDSSNQNFYSMTTVRIPNYDKSIVMDYDIFERDTRGTEHAQAKMLKSLNDKNWFRVTKFENCKSKEIVDPVKKAKEECDAQIKKRLDDFADTNPFFAGCIGLGEAIADGVSMVKEWCTGIALKSKK